MAKLPAPGLLADLVEAARTGDTPEAARLKLVEAAQAALDDLMAGQGFRARLLVDGRIELIAPDGRVLALAMDEFIERFVPLFENPATPTSESGAFLAAFEALQQADGSARIWLADGYAPGQRGNGGEWQIIEEAPKKAIDIRDVDTVLAADPARFSGGHFNTNYNPGFIGPAIGHLPPLADEDYLLRDIPVAPLVPGGHCDDDEAANPVVVVLDPQSISFIEDTNGGFNGALFSGGLPPGAVISGMTASASVTGAVVTVDKDGNFTLVPPPDYSGPITLTFSYIDGTGQRRTAIVESTIAPVSDPALSSPGTAGVEDQPVPIGASLADPLTGIRESDADGSEVITAVGIGAPPAGFVLVVPASSPDVSIVRNADGSISITALIPGDAAKRPSAPRWRRCR